MVCLYYLKFVLLQYLLHRLEQCPYHIREMSLESSFCDNLLPLRWTAVSE